MEIILLLDLSKIMPLMVVPCSQECHLLTSEGTNMYEIADENGAAMFGCVCEQDQKIVM